VDSYERYWTLMKDIGVALMKDIDVASLVDSYEIVL
jgi:hypothetical protein